MLKLITVKPSFKIRSIIEEADYFTPLRVLAVTPTLELINTTYHPAESEYQLSS